MTAMTGARVDAVMDGRRIDLAHEPEFTIGCVRVQPSTRMIIIDGQSEIIEPRMMQVLVAFGRAKGQVVTRDELIDLCWEGRVVGDDALSRVLWRLRQALAKFDRPGFDIETIPRVGYRLVVSESREAAADPNSASARDVARVSGGVSRRSIAVGAAALASVAVVGGLAWAGGGQPHKPPEDAKRFFDQAIELRGQGGYAQCQQVLAYLREAVRIDPDYSDAWGALALQYSFLLDWYAPRPDAKQLKIAGRSAARRALDLDEGNADASAALLLMDSPYGRWDEVGRGLRSLLARHPDHVPANFGLAKLMIETGQFGSALEIFKRLAIERPSWPHGRWRIADILLTLGRLEEAEAQIEIGLRLWPRNFQSWIAKTRFLIISGNEAEAVRYVKDQTTLPIGDDEIVRREALIVEAAATRSAASIQRARDALLALARTGEVAIPAMELPFFGEVDLAFEMYEGYFLDRGPWKSGPMERRYTGGLFEPETALLRKDARFMPLLKASGLTHYYRVAGVKPDFLQA